MEEKWVTATRLSIFDRVIIPVNLACAPRKGRRHFRLRSAIETKIPFGLFLGPPKEELL